MQFKNSLLLAFLAAMAMAAPYTEDQPKEEAAPADDKKKAADALLLNALLKPKPQQTTSTMTGTSSGPGYAAPTGYKKAPKDEDDNDCPPGYVKVKAGEPTLLKVKVGDCILPAYGSKKRIWRNWKRQEQVSLSSHEGFNPPHRAFGANSSLYHHSQVTETVKVIEKRAGNCPQGTSWVTREQACLPIGGKVKRADEMLVHLRENSPIQKCSAGSVYDVNIGSCQPFYGP